MNYIFLNSGQTRNAQCQQRREILRGSRAKTCSVFMLKNIKEHKGIESLPQTLIYKSLQPNEVNKL